MTIPTASLVPSSQTPSTMSACQLSHPPSLICFFPLGPWSFPMEKGRNWLCILWVFQVEASTLACGWISPGLLKTQPVLLPLALIFLRKSLFWPSQQVQVVHLILILFLTELIPMQKKNIYPYLASVVTYQTPYCYWTIRNMASKTHFFRLWSLCLDCRGNVSRCLKFLSWFFSTMIDCCL